MDSELLWVTCNCCSDPVGWFTCVWLAENYSVNTGQSLGKRDAHQQLPHGQTSLEDTPLNTASNGGIIITTVVFTELFQP